MEMNKLIVVVGVFGNLDKAGFKGVTIGVRGCTVAGKTIYKSLKDLPVKSDMILTIIPLTGTDKTVDESISLGIKEVWMQPGSQSEAAVQKA
jgi:predicted CoA-binding protein